MKVLTCVLLYLGFIINFEKSVMQELEFLGMLVNTTTPLICLPADKLKQIRSKAAIMWSMNTLSARLLSHDSHFLGKAQCSNPSHPSCPIVFQTDLQAALICSNQDYRARISLSAGAREELRNSSSNGTGNF